MVCGSRVRTHASMCRAQPEIEQPVSAVLRAYCLGVGAEFGDHRLPAHRARGLGQAQGDALYPAGAGSRRAFDNRFSIDDRAWRLGSCLRIVWRSW